MMCPQATRGRWHRLAQPRQEDAVPPDIETLVALQPLFILRDRGQIIPKSDGFFKARLFKKIKNFVVSLGDNIFQRSPLAFLQLDAAEGQLAAASTKSPANLTRPG